MLPFVELQLTYAATKRHVCAKTGRCGSGESHGDSRQTDKARPLHLHGDEEAALGTDIAVVEWYGAR